MTASLPYRTTPVFDEYTLPRGLRRSHSTKPGTWGIIRVLEGQLRLAFSSGGGTPRLLTPGSPGLVRPEQLHWVEPVGPMRMQVEFYDAPPETLIFV